MLVQNPYLLVSEGLLGQFFIQLFLEDLEL